MKTKPSPPRSRFSGVRAKDFGDVVFMDHCEIKHMGKKHQLFLVLDGATSLLGGTQQEGTEPGHIEQRQLYDSLLASLQTFDEIWLDESFLLMDLTLMETEFSFGLMTRPSTRLWVAGLVLESSHRMEPVLLRRQTRQC